MGVNVALVAAAELEIVAASQPRDVVAIHGVMAVPIARANALVVGVVGNKHVVGVFAADFQGCRVSGNVRHAAGRTIGPPVPCKAKVEVVREAGPNVFGQASGIEPGILRLLTDRLVLALGVAGEESADIPLVRHRVGQLIVVVGAIEVPAFGEVVVDATNAEVAGLRSGDGTCIPAIV